MRITNLIVRAAARVLSAEPSQMGVRVCPVALTPEDVEPLIKEVAAQFGDKVFLAASVPGAPTIDKARIHVSPGKAAAERATQWRNQIKIEDGQHLLYVSVQVHGKAGGLQDCLHPIGEEELREQFVEWCESNGSRVPNGLGTALRDSGILFRVSTGALCAYAQAVAQDGKRSGWAACGHHLTILNLARDTNLRAANAAQRLEENDRIVSKAATGERQGGITDGPLADLRDAFAGDVDEIQDRLGGVDLAKVIDVAKKPKPKVKARTAAKSPKPLPQSRKRKTRGAKGKAVAEIDALLTAAQGASREAKAEALERKAEKLGAATDRDAPMPPAGETHAKYTPAEEPQVWTREQHRREFGALATSLPLGLSGMLVALMSRRGFGLCWPARESPQRLLHELPSKVEPVELVADPVPPSARPTLDAWLAARGDLAKRILGDGGRTGLAALANFIESPLIALSHRQVRESALALLGASTDLYKLATSGIGSQLRHAILALDTVSARTRDGEAVLVVGPLHPLWLGQAVARFDAMLTDSTLTEAARRLLVRSLSEAPAAPENWPSDARPLSLSRPIGGLLTYQSTPDAFDWHEVSEVTDGVLALYTRLAPHSKLGLRVAVLGGPITGILEGAASALEHDDSLRSVVLHWRGEGVPDLTPMAEKVVPSGRLLFEALPLDESALQEIKPHLIFRLISATSSPEITEESAPSQPTFCANGLLPTEFRIVGSGLRVRTPIDSARQPALAAFEAMHALACNRQPLGAFVRTAHAVSLRSVVEDGHLPKSSWDVVLAPRLSSRPPDGRFLLSHERRSERLEVAVVSASVALASRELREGFTALGIQGLPSTIRDLAARLASATSRGVVSPVRSGGHLIAASVLSVALRQDRDGSQAGERFVAHLDGPAAVTLLGVDPAGEPGAMALGFGAVGDTLRLVVGYAAVDGHLPCEVERGKFKGPLADRLERVISSVELAGSDTSVGGVAAREALSWLLWPALATREAESQATQRLLSNLSKGTTRIEISALCYLPSGAPALRQGAKPVRIGSTPVALRPMDIQTFEELVLSGNAVAA